MTADERQAVREAIDQASRAKLRLNDPDIIRGTRSMGRKHCAGVNSRGEPCHYGAPRGERYCYSHRHLDP